MKRQTQVLIVVFVVLLAAWPSLAAQPSGGFNGQPTGELNASIGYEWDKDTKQVVHDSTQAGFRFVLEDDLDSGGRIHLSAKGWWDWKQEDGKLALDQLWMSGYYEDVDYQVGRQVISWGTADGFNPTNYFSRMNSNALLSGDFSGEPMWAGQAIYYAPTWSVTGVVIPIFAPQGIDAQMRRMITDKGPQGTMVLEAIEGTKKPLGLGKNSELALRAETQFAGFDLQASYFSGFEPLPGLEMVLTFNPDLGLVIPSMEGTYRRQRFFGLAATGTLGPAGVWGELSYGGPVAFKESANPLVQRIPLSIDEKYLQAVVGGDYTFDLGKGLLVQGQYIYRGQGSLFEPYVMPNLETMTPGEIESAHYLYGRLGYNFSADSSIDIIILHGFKEEGGLIRPAYTHRFPNSMQLELSLIALYGKEELSSSLGSQARIAVKYQF